MSERNERLLEPHELAEQGPPEAVRLPLDLIDANPRNPRTTLPEVDLLAENIRGFSSPKHSGLMQPVIVRRMGERYELLGGHRRLAAFKLLRDVRDPLNPEWRTIPAVVWTSDDDESLVALISAQVHHQDWKPREEAAALELLWVSGRNQRQIGEALSRTETWANKRLRIYSDSILSGYVQSGKMTRAVAEEFLVVRDAETKRDLAERAAAEQWGHAHARSQVRALRLDKQLREVARRAHELLELLSVIQVDQLPHDALLELNSLRRRIQTLATGAKAVIPTIEQAQQAAGIKTQDRPETRGRPRRAGYKPRL